MGNVATQFDSRRALVASDVAGSAVDSVGVAVTAGGDVGSQSFLGTILEIFVQHKTNPQDSDYALDIFPCRDGDVAYVDTLPKLTVAIPLKSASSFRGTVRDLVPELFGSGFRVQARRVDGGGTATFTVDYRRYRLLES